MTANEHVYKNDHNTSEVILSLFKAPIEISHLRFNVNSEFYRKQEARRVKLQDKGLKHKTSKPIWPNHTTVMKVTLTNKRVNVNKNVIV